MKLNLLLHRAALYAGVVASVTIVALLAEVAKTGHLHLAEVTESLGKWVTHFLTDVTSAEVTVTVIMRTFGED